MIWQVIAAASLLFSGAVLAWGLSVKRKRSKFDIAEWVAGTSPSEWEFSLVGWAGDHVRATHVSGVDLHEDYGIPWHRVVEKSTGETLGLIESRRVLLEIRSMKRRTLEAKIGGDS